MTPRLKQTISKEIEPTLKEKYIYGTQNTKNSFKYGFRT